jgi:ABC-2 type transport system ATP-binding protein
MILIRDLHFSYRRKPVLDGLYLELRPGYIYGLLGKNGTGKSTLLRNLAGLLFPQKGQVLLRGLEPGRRQPEFLQQVFLVPEEFSFPSVTIGQWAKHRAPFYPKFSYELFERTLTEFNVPRDTRLPELSYGQQKKALISFALATNVSLLLMDEPTNGLDIQSKSQFRKVIAGALDEDKCFVISTHQVKDLENLIDRITVLDEGKILFDQPIETISRKLQFKLSFDPEETAAALYAETSLKGNALVTAATAGEGESHPDLELLYKAVLLHRDRIGQLFSGQNGTTH